MRLKCRHLGGLFREAGSVSVPGAFPSSGLRVGPRELREDLEEAEKERERERAKEERREMRRVKEMEGE